MTLRSEEFDALFASRANSPVFRPYFTQAGETAGVAVSALLHTIVKYCMHHAGKDTERCTG